MPGPGPTRHPAGASGLRAEFEALKPAVRDRSIAPRPAAQAGGMAVRRLLPLPLGFGHRAVTGADLALPDRPTACRGHPPGVIPSASAD